MSASVSAAHILPFLPAFVALSAAFAAVWAITQLRGLSDTMRVLHADLVQVQAAPMLVRVTVRPTGAPPVPVLVHDAPVIVPDRSPLLELAPDGRVAA